MGGEIRLRQFTLLKYPRCSFMLEVFFEEVINRILVVLLDKEGQVVRTVLNYYCNLADVDCMYRILYYLKFMVLPHG